MRSPERPHDDPGFGLVAKAGPLAMRDFAEGATDATIRNWTPGTLEKVVLVQVESEVRSTFAAAAAATVTPPDRMTFLTGYMLFISEGDWRIEARSGESLLGSAILRVQRGS
jgi:hypothetical protein